MLVKLWYICPIYTCCKKTSTLQPRGIYQSDDYFLKTVINGTMKIWLGSGTRWVFSYAGQHWWVLSSTIMIW